MHSGRLLKKQRALYYNFKSPFKIIIKTFLSDAIGHTVMGVTVINITELYA